jgi:nicotinate phosphoribosyltransferase
MSVPKSFWMNFDNVGLNNDLHEITMAAASFLQNTHQEWVTYEYFMSELPAGRNFIIFAGLEQIIHYVEALNFRPDWVRAYLKDLPCFANIPEAFFDDYLKNFRFSGNLFAVPEGTVVFAREPAFVIQAPRGEAQLLETFLLSMVNYQSLCATKAARIRLAAGRDRYLIDMGSRRAPCPQAAIYNGRASYIGGFNSTSNLLPTFYDRGIPVFGGISHAYIRQFGPENEREAFKALLRAFPGSILPLDTYHALERGISNVLAAIDELETEGSFERQDLAGVRINTGNLFEQTIQIRNILDSHGLLTVQVVLSGDLNEFKIHELESQFRTHQHKTGQTLGKISYGVSTEQAISADSPFLPGVYKLSQQESQMGPRKVFKLSEEKSSYPGFKQIYRFYDETGQWDRDKLMFFDEPAPTEGFPLLIPMMNSGRTATDPENLDQIRARTWVNIQSLPCELLGWDCQPADYFDQRLEASEAILGEVDRGLASLKAS